VIFLARDPRDVIVSSFFEMKNRGRLFGEDPYEQRQAVFDGSLQEFIERRVGGFDTLLAYYSIWAQNRNALRAVFGVPRSFIEMQDQGRLMKRFLFSDPYAPTSLADITGGLTVVVVFYVAMAAVLYPLLSSTEGRRFFVLLLIAGLPVLVFAVILFEPGSPERYIPLYPFLACAAVRSLTARSGLGRVPAYAGLVLLATISTSNLRAMSWSRASERQAAQEQRIGTIRDRVRGGGMVAILSNRDDLMAFSKTYPFNPLNRPDGVPIYEVIEVGNARVQTWREDFAVRVLGSWARNSEVWVSERFLAERPAPEWQWVEGDDPRISWKQIPEFFRTLDYQTQTGGLDGFSLLRNSAANRVVFEKLAASLIVRGE
jgi:hypothetical protein